jgi:hypothetical protein
LEYPLSKRVVFVDQARSLAIVLMLFGHSFDRFLGEPWRSGPLYTNYQFFRGISSALFILLAGFSFSVATLPKYTEYLTLSPKLVSRFKRILLIIFLGFLLQAWAPTLLGSIRSYSLAHLEYLFSFNVLQNIGSNLALLHLVLLATRNINIFILASVFMSAALFSLAPITFLPSIDSALPLPIAAMVNLYHFSRFPLIPYGGYAFAGAVMGALYLKFNKLASISLNVLMISFGFLGVLLIIGEVFLRRSGIEVFPFTTARPQMPGYTFARAGTAILVVASLFALGKWSTLFPVQSKTISKDSLAIYFVHLFLVYGCASFPGLFPSLSRQMNPLMMWTWNISLLILMYGLAKGIGLLRDWYPRALTFTLRFVILAFMINFICAPTLHPFWIALSLLISFLLVFKLNRRFGLVT